MYYLNRCDYLPRPACGERDGVRGGFFEFGQEQLKNPVHIFNDIVVQTRITR
jgi:hypothetical protein